MLDNNNRYIVQCNTQKKMHSIQLKRLFSSIRGKTEWENSLLELTQYSQSHMQRRENEVVHLLGAPDKHGLLTLYVRIIKG